MAKLRTDLKSSIRLAMPLKLVSSRGLVQMRKQKRSLKMPARKNAKRYDELSTLNRVEPNNSQF